MELAICEYESPAKGSRTGGGKVCWKGVTLVTMLNRVMVYGCLSCAVIVWLVDYKLGAE